LRVSLFDFFWPLAMSSPEICGSSPLERSGSEPRGEVVVPWAAVPGRGGVGDGAEPQIRVQPTRYRRAWRAAYFASRFALASAAESALRSLR
jgi:hypothetical protein